MRTLSPLSAALMASASTLALPALAGVAAQVDVITVTATKRAESIQDVPIAVTALSTAQLEDSGVQDVKDLINIAPGLMVTSTASEFVTTARIRGIGTVGDNPGLESSVGIFVDGVFRSRNGVGFGDLGELDRVEILRGPQGTLFGKNTSAGVIGVITKKPSFDHGAGAELTLGNFGLWRAAGYVTGGNAAKTAAFRLFAAKAERNGYMDIETGEGPRDYSESYDSDYHTLRGQALFTPNDDVEIRLIADYTRRDEDCCGAVQTFTGATTNGYLELVNAGLPAKRNTPDPDAWVGYANRTSAQQLEDWGLSGQIDWQTEAGAFTSITAFRNFETNIGQDLDFTTADIFYRPADENANDFENFSQEFRLAGTADGVEWLVGAYYGTEDLVRDDALRMGSDYGAYLNLLVSGSTTYLSDAINATSVGHLYSDDIFPLGSGTTGDEYHQDATTMALFTHNTVRIAADTDVTVGLRWTREEKELGATFNTDGGSGCGFFVDPNPSLGGQTGNEATAGVLASRQGTYCLYWVDPRYNDVVYDAKRSDEQLSGTIKVSQQLADNTLGYASYARGFKAGGFNLDRSAAVRDGLAQDTAFAPEIIDALELGLKSELADGQVRLNATAFYQSIDDFQLNTFTGISFIVANVEEATSQGLELDLAYAPAQIDGLSVSGGAAYIDAQYGDDISNAGLAGKTMTLSPDVMANLGVTYKTPLGAGWTGRFHVEGRYVSTYNTGSDLDVEKDQDGFGLLNARIGLHCPKDVLTVELWGKNLTDETYQQVAFDAPLQSGGYNAFLGAPRTYGVSVKADF